MERLQAPEWLDRSQPDSAFMWQAYWHLDGSRGIGGGIPFSEIAKYAEWAGITCPVQKTRLVNIIISLDNSERPNGATA